MTDEKQKESQMSTDQPLRPLKGNQPDTPIIKNIQDPVRQTGFSQIPVQTLRGVSPGAEVSKQWGVIPGSGENVPKPNMVPQKPGQSTEKPVKEPEQPR